MGDDMIAYWQLERDLGAEDRAKLMRVISAVVTKVAAENGHSVNELKNIVRYFLSEYLKKAWTYGYFIPRGQIQLLAGERGGNDPDSASFLRNHSALCDLYENRLASNTRVGYIVSNLMTCFRRNYRWRVGPASGFIYVPFSVHWTPIALGGVGKLPHTINGSNVDNVIAIYAGLDPELKDVINDAAEFVSHVKSSIRDQIKDSMTAAAKKARRGVTP